MNTDSINLLFNLCLGGGVNSQKTKKRTQRDHKEITNKKDKTKKIISKDKENKKTER